MTTTHPQSSSNIESGSSAPARIKGARFWDWIARRYVAKPIADEQAYAHKLKLTREYLFQDAKVLEIGCGTGSTAIAHAPFVRRIDACDFSAKMIEIGRERAATKGVANVRFACREAGDLPDEVAAYDAVLALNVLHLLPHWRRVIKRVYQKLQPGGVFISTTPCLNTAPAIVRLVVPACARLGVLPALSFFSQDALEQALTDAGFDLEYAWQANPKIGLFLVAKKPC